MNSESKTIFAPDRLAWKATYGLEPRLLTDAKQVFIIRAKGIADSLRTEPNPEESKRLEDKIRELCKTVHEHFFRYAEKETTVWFDPADNCFYAYPRK